jgi:large subunit ribosomal protein L32e
MAKKFTRRCTNYYLKLGSKQKSKRRWRRERGLDSKVRRMHKGRPSKVLIGFGTAKKERYLIKNKTPVLIKNLKELNKIDKGKNIIIIARIGRKKREEIIKVANENKVQILNFKGEIKK